MGQNAYLYQYSNTYIYNKPEAGKRTCGQGYYSNQN